MSQLETLHMARNLVPEVIKEKKEKPPSIKRIRVHLDKRSYDIVIGFDWIGELGSHLRLLKLSGEVMVFTSPRIGALYFDAVKTSLEDAGFSRILRFDIPDGEKNKDFPHYEKCLGALLKHFPTPGSAPLVVNLGGGVVGDLGGFAAATFNRGLSYVQVPTTLLGFVDCGVGGKVGVNFGDIKNLIGTFYQPKLVFADLTFLNSLLPREIRSGTAEVIKYGAVCSRDLFLYLEENIDRLLSLDKAVVTKTVTDCYAIKAKVVQKDECDQKGIRIVLNFGHTIGHALEMAADCRMTHGEAISVGMLAATKIALELGVCNPTVYNRLRALIERAGLPTSAKGMHISTGRVLEIIHHDKKFQDGNNRFILPSRVGGWVERRGIDESLIEKTVNQCLR